MLDQVGESDRILAELAELARVAEPPCTFSLRVHTAVQRATQHIHTARICQRRERGRAQVPVDFLQFHIQARVEVELKRVGSLLLESLVVLLELRHLFRLAREYL